MYHQVGPFQRVPSHRAVYCHHRRFARQMAYLKWAGYRVVDLAEGLAALRAGGLPPRAVCLTFDDGYRNFLDYAWPVLEHYRYPVTVFLVSGRIGGEADWLTAAGLAPAALLDAQDIRRLQRAGVRFGAHSRSHPRLTRLPDAALAEEVAGSKADLEALLDAPVEGFCYPSGDFDARVRAAVAAAGFRMALTCVRGDARVTDDPLALPRKAISFGDSLLGYGWKLARRKGPAVEKPRP